MTYVFIINPSAGKTDWVRKTLFDLQLLRQNSNHTVEIYVTEHRGHATTLAKIAAQKYNPLRIYACGGDGTIYEVLQGIVGCTTVEFGCVPIGSGNDFIKNFQKKDFLNLENQLTAPSIPVDIISVTGEFGHRYSMNVVSFSWDSRVALEVEIFKKIPLVSGSVAYGLSAISQLVKKKSTMLSIDIDGESLPTKGYMIGMCANGAYYGGGFQGAPLAKLDDGLFDLVLVETITRRQVAVLFPKYQAGTHFTQDKAKFQDILTHRKGKKVSMTSDDKIPVTIDGEGFYTRFLQCEMLPQKIKFIAPGEYPKNALVR